MQARVPTTWLVAALALTVFAYFSLFVGRETAQEAIVSPAEADAIDDAAHDFAASASRVGLESNRVLATAMDSECAEPATAGSTGRLEVVVLAVEPEHGTRPLSQVAIELSGRSGPHSSQRLGTKTTDDEGFAAWSSLPSGSYLLDLHGLTTRTVDVRADEVREISIVLSHLVEVEGLVTDPGGIPIPEAAVLVSENEDSGHAVQLATTNSMGEFSLTTNLIGRRHVSVTSDLYEMSASQPLVPQEFGSNDARVLHFKLTRGGREVAGRVLDSEQRPVADADMQLRLFTSSGVTKPGYLPRSRQQTYPIRRTTTAPDGTFSFQGIPRAAFELTATRCGFTAGRVSSESGSVNWANITLVLQKGASVAGRIVDRQGLPLGEVNVGHGPWASPRGRWVLTDEEGRFELDSLPSGVLDVQVHKPGYESRVERLTLAESEVILDAEWSLIASGGHLVSGRIEPARPYEGGTWFVRLQAEEESAATSAPGGEFAIRNWNAGHASIEICFDLGGQLVASREFLSTVESEPLVIRVPSHRSSTTQVVGRVVARAEEAPERMYVSFGLLGSRLRLETVTSMADGSFRKILPSQGQWAYQVKTLDGELRYSGVLGASCGARIDLGDLQLELPGELRLVRSSDPTRDLPDRVSILNVAGSLVFGTNTKTNRRLELPPGRYTIVATTDNVLVASRTLEIEAGKSTEFLMESPSATGSVLRIRGADELLEEAWIRLLDERGETVHSSALSSGRDRGSKEWAMACAPGRYEFELTTRLEPPLTRTIFVEPTRDLVVEFGHERACPLSRQ